MAGDALGNTTTRVFVQVLRASANHKVEHETHLLRPKGYTLPSNPVYLGDITVALLVNLSHPETPHFPQPPRFNEQRWTLLTQSGNLRVKVQSAPYWGFGLFNSGYVNAIEIAGPYEQRMRLLYDLKASVGRNPWEFSHRQSMGRWMSKHHSDSTLESNEAVWRAALQSAKVAFETSIELLEQRSDAVGKRMNSQEEGPEWILEKAQVAYTSAQVDLGMARKALAEENAPGLERALARAEAALIEADPATGLLIADYDASAPEGMALRVQGAHVRAATSDLEIVDLTGGGNEEE